MQIVFEDQEKVILVYFLRFYQAFYLEKKAKNLAKQLDRLIGKLGLNSASTRVKKDELAFINKMLTIVIEEVDTKKIPEIQMIENEEDKNDRLAHMTEISNTSKNLLNKINEALSK